MAEMTFDEKFAKCKDAIHSITYNSYKGSEINKFADAVELLALFHKDSGITKGDVTDILYGENDESLEDEDNNEVSESENNDRKEAFIDDIFKRLNDRIVLFGNSYPFKLDKDTVFLKKNINISNKNYIFLLISSSLDIFKQFQPTLTTDFETISFEAFKKYLPSATIKQFGKNSEYQGNAKSKIIQLAKDMGLSVNDYEISQIDEKNTQERGLDIVGWIPFEDKCHNKIVFLCQCACGKKYENKQHDTRRFENYYVFYKTKPQHTLFIPSSLININEQKFYDSDCIENGYLIFERKRIVSLLKGKNVINGLSSKELIEKCLTDTSEYH